MKLEDRSFIETQETRKKLLGEMLSGFNDGRSKSYYCIATTVLEIDELRGAIHRAAAKSEGLDACPDSIAGRRLTSISSSSY